MSRKESVILTNMCMITDGDKVLVQDRKSSNEVRRNRFCSVFYEQEFRECFNDRRPRCTSLCNED